MANSAAKRPKTGFVEHTQGKHTPYCELTAAQAAFLQRSLKDEAQTHTHLTAPVLEGGERCYDEEGPGNLVVRMKLVKVGDRLKGGWWWVGGW